MDLERFRIGDAAAGHVFDADDSGKRSDAVRFTDKVDIQDGFRIASRAQ